MLNPNKINEVVTALIELSIACLNLLICTTELSFRIISKIDAGFFCPGKE